jgi:hypothetical protein
MSDWIGWLATAAFASSYFFKSTRALRYVQALAAGLWIIYGLLLHAYPVVASNLVIAVLAAWSAWLGLRPEPAKMGESKVPAES